VDFCTEDYIASSHVKNKVERLEEEMDINQLAPSFYSAASNIHLSYKQRQKD